MSTPSTKDPILADHLAWLGYVQPEGLVVSAPALVDSQVVIVRACEGRHVADFYPTRSHRLNPVRFAYLLPLPRHSLQTHF